MRTAEQNEGLSLAESLVARIANGEKLAEQQLVKNYYRGLFFVLNRQCKNSNLSEDLTQDTFILVIQKARDGLIRNPAALAAFIRQTGINLLIGHIRKETRHDTHCAEDIEIHAPSENLDLSHALHNEKVLALVQQVMTELPTDRDREMLRNYFVYDKNKQQICHELDLSPEHFDRVLFRARQRLKQLIEHKLSSPLRKSDSSDVTTLLSLLVMLGLVYQLPSSTELSLFLIVVRETPQVSHLTFETPEQSSRFTSNYLRVVSEEVGKQLKPESRGT